VGYTRHQVGQRMQEYLYFPIVERGGKMTALLIFLS